MARRERRLTKRERKAFGTTEPSFEERVQVRAARQGISPESIRRGGLPDRPKMSDVLKEWAAPLLEPLRGDIRKFTNGVRFAATVWNAATKMPEPPEVVADWLVEAAGSIGIPFSGDTRDMLAHLITTRREDYADDDRIVIDTEVCDGGDEYRITVASALVGGSAPDPS